MKRITLLSILCMFLTIPIVKGQTSLSTSGVSGITVENPPAGTATRAYQNNGNEAYNNLAPVTITHSVSQTIVNGGGVACGAGGVPDENNYYRVFDLSADFGITTGFTVSNVEFGVEEATGPIQATLNIYSTTNTFPTGYPGSLTLRGTVDYTIVAADAGTVVSVPLAAIIPAGETMVYEYHINPGATNTFYPGANDLGQTDTSWIQADACDIFTPTSETGMGFPDMHLVMNVIGEEGIDACNGMPNIGVVIINPVTGNPGSTYTVSAQGTTTATGMSFQWQSNINSGGWLDTGAATNVYEPYVATAPSQPGDEVAWRLLSTCIATSDTAISAGTTFTTSAITYCPAAGNNPSYENITNVTYAGINNTTTTHAGYNDFTAQVATVTQESTEQISVTISADGSDYVYVFIDWNQNGTLDDTGEVYTLASDTSDDGPYTMDISVPEWASVGNTRMRVKVGWNESTPNPCGSFTYGEIEDYTIQVLGAGDCSGTPDAGVVSVNPEEGNVDSNYTVSATGITFGGGMTYQWESNTDGAGWIPEGNLLTLYAAYTATAPAELGIDVDWRLNSTCTISGQTAVSNVATFTTALTYCDVTFPSAVEPITYVNFGDIDNTSDATVDGSPALEDFTAQTASVNQGDSYPIEIKGNTAGSFTSRIVVYVDWNQDGIFDDSVGSDEMYMLPNIVNSSGEDAISSEGFIQVPASAMLGDTRMRVMKKFSSVPGPCNSQGYGQAEDYTVSVSAFVGYVYEGGAWTPNDPSGVSTDSDNVLVMDGTTSLTADTDVKNLIIETGATLNINNVLNLHGDLTINGDLVFVSTATGNGELGIVGGTITGDATVQRYMSANRSYRMVSSAVTTSTTVYDNWQEGGVDTNTGFGTHITGSETGSDGFDATATGNPSMFIVDYLSDPIAFEAVTNTNSNTLDAGTPYLLFVRGDRSMDLGDNASVGATTLRATGTLQYGNQDPQNFATASAGDFAMFGNPYQSVVNVNSLFEHGGTNINDGRYYVYDPTQGTHGAYVTVELPTGTHTGTSTANQYLQPGQGAQFATSGNGVSTLEFTEANKAPGQFTTTSATDNRLSADNMLTVQLFTTENFSNGGPTHDSFGIIFGDGLDNGITSADARKPMNFYENFGRDHNGTYLSLERREMPVPAEVYSLYSSGYSHADYTLKMIVDGLEDTFLYLDDHYTGTSTLLEGSDTVYTFSVDANDELSIATDRFSVRVEQRLGVDDNGLLSGVRLFPNPLNDNTFYINAPKLNGEQISVSISDLSGRQIFENMLDCRANTVTVSVNDNLASGVYLVTLRHGGEESTYRLIKR